jgi:hypothetical protein
MGASSPYTDGGARLGVAQYLVSGPPNLTVDGYRNLQCDAAGNLCVNVKAGGGGGSGGAVTIADPTTGTNQAAVLAPGGVGAYALAVQGVTGGTPIPVSGSFTTTGTVTANAGTGFPTASAPGTPGTLLTTIQGSPSGTAVPVSGVFYQATQPVSLASFPALTTGAATIGIVNAGVGFPSLTTAGVSGTNLITVQGSSSGVGIPVTGTFWQTVQPISATALPLPTGAATSANQIVVGTAGTASSQVVSVQGIAGGTAQPVSLATLPALVASTANIGNVGGKTAKIATALTVTASSAYTTGNVVGGKITFSSALLTAGSGVLESISLRSKSVQTATFTLFLFDSNPTNTTWTDKTAPSINVNDIPFLVGAFQLSSFSSGLGTHTIYMLNGISQTLAAGATTLYGILIVTGTPTFTATTDLTLALGILQD